MMNRKHYEDQCLVVPSPRQIRRACREIQKGWSTKMRRRRDMHRTELLGPDFVTLGVLNGRGVLRT